MSALSPPARLSPLAIRGGALLLAAAVLLCVLAALPYFWQARLAEDVAAQKAELALVKAKVLKHARTRGPVLTEADEPQRLFLPGETAGTMLAAFQGLVSDAAVRSGMSVLRMQPLPADEVQGLSPYRLAVDVSGSLDQLGAFLADVESMAPMITVTGFEITPRGEGGPEAQPYRSEDLAASLRLEAYGWRATP